MLQPETLTLRQQYVRSYLQALEMAAHVSWQELREYNFSLAYRLMLVHPRWHALDRSSALDLLPFSRALRGDVCQSEKLWGYSCPLTDRSIEADHMFPKSLGGPRNGSNQVWLCSDHNLWKGQDLFNFPWENGEPQWLHQQLNRVEGLLTLNARWHG
jgi:hypothetical protein